MDIGNEKFTIDERDEFGRLADELSEWISRSYAKDPSTVTQEELAILTVARAYLRLYQVVFTNDFV